MSPARKDHGGGEEAFPYSESETDFIEQLLFDEAGDEALDLFGLHGLLTALLIHPGRDFIGEAILTLVTGDSVSLTVQQNSRLLQLIVALAAHIGGQLDQEDAFVLPSEVYDDEDARISWSSGFMEGVFRHEEIWFSPAIEDRSAQLLLPIMVHSGLYDATELNALQNDAAMMVSMLEQIPEVVIDLNLLLNAQP